MCNLYSLYTLNSIYPPMNWLTPANSRQQCEPAPPATTRSSTTATPWAVVRRAGHAAPGDVVHFAREKGYKAATLRTAPRVCSLPGTASYASNIFARACCMRSCTRRAAARPFSPPSSNRRISREVAHCKKTSRWSSGSRADKTRSMRSEARDSMDSIEIIFFLFYQP